MLKTIAFVAAGLMLASPAVATAQGVAPVLSAQGTQQREENLTKRRADLAPLIAKRQALKKQYGALMTPAGYDEAQLAATMTEMRQIEGQIVETQQNSVLALLKGFSAEDRNAYLSVGRRAPAATVKPGEGR